MLSFGVSVEHPSQSTFTSPALKSEMLALSIAKLELPGYADSSVKVGIIS